MARFAAPTCWNLLHIVHMDGRLDDQGTTTVFTQVRARLAASVGKAIYTLFQAGWLICSQAQAHDADGWGSVPKGLSIVCDDS